MTMEVYDADELVSYQSLSNLAILALVLGLLSPLALMVPMFFILPLAGIAVAFLAINSIRSQPEVLTGTTLAKIGLFLSVFCLVSPPMKTLVRTQFYQQQADQLAEQWLVDLAEGNLEKAVNQMTVGAKRGLVPLDPATGKPSVPASAAELTEMVLQALQQDPLVESLRGLSQSGTPDFQAVSHLMDPNRTEPAVAIQYQAQQRDESLLATVHCLRVQIPNGTDHWRIEAWKLDSAPQN